MVVKYLPGPGGIVSVFAEIRTNRLMTRNDFPPILIIGLHSGSMGCQPRHESRPGRIAHRAGTVSMGKIDRLFRKLNEMGRPCLEMSPQGLDPVIQIIHGNEQDVGFLPARRPACTNGQHKSQTAHACRFEKVTPWNGIHGGLRGQ